jgi:two-component system, NarL family, capsular synthesis sensor histidine kinase RcsC
MTMTRVQSRPSTVAGAATPPGRDRRPRLMVVDAAEAPRAALREYFAARGWDVVLVSDGVQAVTRSLADGIDVVVMDVWLPDLEGFEAAAILRALDPRIRIILTCDAGARPERRGRRRSESFRCFPKPLDLDALARAVDEASTGPAKAGEGPR